MNTLELVRISDLPNKPHSVRIQVRIIRVWAATPPDSAVIWYYGTVLLDTHGGVIEARILKSDYQRLSRLIEEGRICEIAKFSVADAPIKYHVVPGDHILYFTRFTTVTPLASSSIQIPLHFFAFERLDIIGTEIRDTNKIIDVIGRIAGFSPLKQTSLSKPFQIMYLADERGAMLEMTLWSQFLAIFDIPGLHQQSMTQPVIVICAAVQINKWDHVYGIKAISGTRFYFDRTIPEIVQFTASLPANLPPIILDTEGPPYDGAPVANPVQQIDRPEPHTVTISDFLAIHVDAYSSTLYKCVATIADLKNRYQWHYEACKKCSSKLKDKYCKTCDMYRNDSMNWYKLLLDVKDETGNAEFTALGKIARQMTGLDVDDMLQIQKSTKTDVPKPLLAIIGKAYEFVVLPKEAPNYPGIRRNTIMRLNAVPPTASPCLPIKAPDQAGTSASHQTEQHSDNRADSPATAQDVTEEITTASDTIVPAPTTPGATPFSTKTMPSFTTERECNKEELATVGTATARKRLFTDADSSSHQDPHEMTVPEKDDTAGPTQTKTKKIKTRATSSGVDDEPPSHLP